MIFDRLLDALEDTPSLNFNSLKQLQSLMVDYDLSNISRARNQPSANLLGDKQTLLN